MVYTVQFVSALVSAQSVIEFQTSLFALRAAINDVTIENITSKFGHNIAFFRFRHLPLAETKATRLLYPVVDLHVHIKWPV